MLFNGEWQLCGDGAVRPILRGEVESGSGSWVEVTFLVDTGADRTVLSADVLAALGLAPISSRDRLGGVGGIVGSVVLETRLQFPREDRQMVVFGGQFAAMTQPESLDMSVLGRDITNLFAVIVDRPGDRVCLVGQRHQYRIEPA